jgi:hypothetical protein
MIFLSTTSDGLHTAGLGSITQWHLLLFCISKELNVNVSVDPYYRIGHNYHSVSNWDETFTKFFNFPYTKKFDVDLDFDGSYDELKEGLISIEKEYESSKRVGVHISHGTIKDIIISNKNLISEFCEKKYLDEIKNNFYIEDTYFSSEYINVSFHIRVENPKDTDHAFHLRETVYDLDKEFNRHKNIIKYIKDENSDKKIHLHIHSQEDEDRYHNFYQFCDENFKVSLHLDDNPIRDIYHMCNADYLIMANSSYSWICHLLNSNTTFARDNFWQPMNSKVKYLDYNYNVI